MKITKCFYYIIKREIHTIHIKDGEDVTVLYELLL